LNPDKKPLDLVVAQGWILMFLAFLCVNLIEFVNASTNGRLGFFMTREGGAALRVMVTLMLVHAFVPMLVVHFRARAFRWTIAALTMLFGLLMMAHEAAHLLLVRDRPFGFFDLLDITHHALALWVSAIAVRWAREAPEAPRATAQAET